MNGGVIVSPSTVTGSFLTVGFASDLCRPSRVALTKGSAEGELKPAVECIQDTAWHTSSTANLELVSSPRCCRYKAKRCGFAGMGSKPLAQAQFFHLRKARRYFITVLSARLRRMVAGSLQAKACSSGSSSSSNNFQLPCACTSVDNKTCNYSDIVTYYACTHKPRTHSIV